MRNRIINKITFTEDYWFDHMGDNPKAKKKTRTVQKPGGRGFGEEWKSYPKVKEEWIKLTLFKKGETIEFATGLNVIVGQNGSGKSTLIRLLTGRKDDGYVIDATGAYRMLDFETGNARYAFDPDPNSDSFMNDSIAKWFANEESHGETLTRQFNAILDCEDTCIILDEPETALSIMNQYKYRELLSEKSKTNQIIIVTHCKTFIEGAANVFDMSARKWTTGDEYIRECSKPKYWKSCKR